MTFRPDPGTTWLRYRGSAKRGRQDLRTAVIDLDHAIESLTRARDVLASVPGLREDRRLRERLIAEAREHAELAQRFVRDVVRGVLRGGTKRRTVAISLQIKLPW